MVTREEMQEIDQQAINTLGVPGIVLMENAAIHFVYQLDPNENHYLIIASVGNNGGDGLAIARQLLIQRKNVKTIVIGNLKKATSDFKTNFQILKNLHHSITVTKDPERIEHILSAAPGFIVIDAIFGTGLHDQVREPYAEIIRLINTSDKKVISVDIPSGLDANSGKPLGICIQAQRTITMHAVKQGLISGRDFTGEVSVASIGIPLDFPTTKNSI